MSYSQVPVHQVKNNSSSSFDTNVDEDERDYFGDNSNYKININSGAYDPLIKLGNIRKNQHQKSYVKKGILGGLLVIILILIPSVMYLGGLNDQKDVDETSPIDYSVTEANIDASGANAKLEDEQAEEEDENVVEEETAEEDVGGTDDQEVEGSYEPDNSQKMSTEELIESPEANEEITDNTSGELIDETAAEGLSEASETGLESQDSGEDVLTENQESTDEAAGVSGEVVDVEIQESGESQESTEEAASQKATGDSEDVVDDTDAEIQEATEEAAGDSQEATTGDSEEVVDGTDAEIQEATEEAAGDSQEATAGDSEELAEGADADIQQISEEDNQIDPSSENTDSVVAEFGQEPTGDLAGDSQGSTEKNSDAELQGANEIEVAEIKEADQESKVVADAQDETSSDAELQKSKEGTTDQVERAEVGAAEAVTQDTSLEVPADGVNISSAESAGK